MSEQEIRNKMDFIVEQQAQFVIDLQQLREEQAKATARVSRLEGAIVTVVNLIGDLSKAQKANDERVSIVVEKVDALTERLDTFINMMVERTLSEQSGDSNGNN
jgi:hypothetical protein